MYASSMLIGLFYNHCNMFYSRSLKGKKREGMLKIKLAYKVPDSIIETN